MTRNSLFAFLQSWLPRQMSHIVGHEDDAKSIKDQLVIKPKYRNNLEFIEGAFEASWQNANDLIKSAKLLLDEELHGIALSISVLALEELGKLFCIDGLLFARSDDHKAETYAKSLKSHTTKLSSLTLLPLLLGNIAKVDPRYATDIRFSQAIAISMTDLKNKGNAVFGLLPNTSFQDLDALKQQGFYAQPYNNVFKAPNSAINRDVSEAVYSLAWRAVTTLDFLFKSGNLKRYIESARSLRTRMTKEQHTAIEDMAKDLYESLFMSEEHSGDEKASERK
jgi:AbiV family abortive infection protein